MGCNFRCGDREQQFLLPPSVRDWLPEDHLAWFVLDVVGEFDLSGFYGRYRVDGGAGRPMSRHLSWGCWSMRIALGMARRG
jgi:hypothetical protein